MIHYLDQPYVLVWEKVERLSEPELGVTRSKNDI